MKLVRSFAWARAAATILCLSAWPAHAESTAPAKAPDKDPIFGACWGSVWSVEVWARPGTEGFAYLVLDMERCVADQKPEGVLYLKLKEAGSSNLLALLVGGRTAKEKVYVVFEKAASGPGRRIVRVDLPGSAVENPGRRWARKLGRSPAIEGNLPGRPEPR